MSKVRLQDMTWTEVQTKMQAGVTCVIPFGSQEQHGPQTPMGDFLICERVAVAAAERSGDVVAPIIPFGYSEYFKSYPGTISVRPETLAAVLEDYVDCLAGQGFQRLVFLSGHAGNAGLLDQLCRRLRAERRWRIPVVSPLSFRNPELYRELFGADQAAIGHGGEPVASLQLFLNASSARPDLAVSGARRGFHGLAVKGVNQLDFHGTSIQLDFNYDEITEAGVIGDPRESSAEKGKALFESIVDGCAAFLEWWRSVPAHN